MQGDLDIQIVREFLQKNPDLPVVRVLRNSIFSALADLRDVTTISLDGDVAQQTLGKLYAFERLNELFDHLGFDLKKSPPQKTSYR